MKIKEMVCGKTVGSLQYEEYFQDRFDWVLIYDIFVCKNFRRKGIMKKMVLELKEKFQNLYLAVKKTNKTAIIAYQKTGFVFVKEYKDYYIMAFGEQDKIYQLENADFCFD